MGDRALEGVDAHLDELRRDLTAPRRAIRQVRKAGGVEALITPEQRRWARRAAASMARGETPADITKPSRGAKVLKGQRSRVGKRSW